MQNLKSKVKPKRDMKSNKYFGDYYIKDFKYISPEVLKRKNINRRVNLGCTLFVKLWLEQVLKGFKQFLYEGSLHGVKYIFEPSFSRKERVTWIIIVVLSISFCAVNIIQLFSKWTSTPFVNVIDSLPTPIWAVPFPSVVLCPHLHVKLSFANVSELDNIDRFFASLVCPQMDSEKRRFEFNRRLSVVENVRLQDFIVKGSPKCSEIVKMCHWRSEYETERFKIDCCEKLLKPIFTDYGLCYTFNGLPLNGMTNRTLEWQKSFNNYVSMTPLEWDLDTGYPKVFPPKPGMLPFRVMASGEVNGLGIELFLNTSEHQFDCDGNNIGFNIIISSPTDHAYKSTILRLPMDRMTTVEVSAITYKTDSSLRNLSPEQRQCFFQNERNLKYYEFYTDTNCKLDLRIQETMKQCNCVPFNWPRKHISNIICSTKADYKCVSDVRARVGEQLIFAYYADSEEQRQPHAAATSCYPACNDVLYSTQVYYSDLIKDPKNNKFNWGNPKNYSSFAYFFDAFNFCQVYQPTLIPLTLNIILSYFKVFSYVSFLTQLLIFLGTCLSFHFIACPSRRILTWIKNFREELTSINVHFYTDMFLGQHRHAQYDDYYFAGAIGGLLSLFLGFSIISVAELVYFVILKPIHIAFKNIYYGNY